MSDLKRNMCIVHAAVNKAKAEGRTMGLKECRATHTRTPLPAMRQVQTSLAYAYRNQLPAQAPQPRN